MYMANDEQNRLAKCIKKCKTKKKAQNNSNLKKVKEDLLNSTMALFKGREILFKAFESRTFSKLKKSERSEQSSDDFKYNSFSYDT